MSALSRVVWSEGMHLAQHHFQAQSRYFEDLLGFTVSSLFFQPYGLIACGLDADALLNGTVSLIHGRGVLPDGLTFDFPADPVPEPLAIGDLFSPTQDSHLVLLAIPRFQPGRSNTALPGSNGAEARFVAAEQAVLDETTGLHEARVGVARKNFRLLLDHQLEEGRISIPIARVRRDGSGHFVYDADYVPPVLRVGGSPRLLGMLSRTIEMLDAKADALAAERSGGAGPGDRGAGEVASFWLSHAIHSSLPALRHHLHSGDAHPERLFVDLSRLAGALCTFSLTSHPRSLPLYDHDRLEQCFGTLDRHIRDHLEVVIPTNCVSIPLQAAGEHLYHGTVVDRRAFDRGQWFLGVRSPAGTADLLAAVPRLVKVCSAKYIERLVREAYPGLALEHATSPPTELPARPGTAYFRIEQAGPCWQSMMDTAQIGVYAPAAIADADLELLVVLE